MLLQPGFLVPSDRRRARRPQWIPAPARSRTADLHVAIATSNLQSGTARRILTGILPVDDGGHLNGCVLVHRRQEVLVQVLGDSRAGLPKPGAHDLDGDARTESGGRVAVPCVMQADLGQAEALQVGTEPDAEPIRGYGRSVWHGEHEAVIHVARSDYHAIFKLELAPLPQRGHRARVELEHALTGSGL